MTFCEPWNSVTHNSGDMNYNGGSDMKWSNNDTIFNGFFFIPTIIRMKRSNLGTVIFGGFYSNQDTLFARKSV